MVGSGFEVRREACAKCQPLLLPGEDASFARAAKPEAPRSLSSKKNAISAGTPGSDGARLTFPVAWGQRTSLSGSAVRRLRCLTALRAAWSPLFSLLMSPIMNEAQ